MSSRFYITTTLPYVNAEPHIGFAGELIRADIVARYHKLMGEEVFFNTGTDEHGLKIYRKALENGEDPQKYVDRYAEKYRGLIKILSISEDINFTRTTDAHHKKAAQEFWKICDKNGFIYKKKYQAKYCVGCELEKTDSELEDGKCPIHPNLRIELIDEENYFFRFSAFEKDLLNLYEKNPAFVIPDFRLNEIKAFVSRGLQDFSISRLKSKMPWGIPVPGDDDQVMYVWFDALINYVAVLGWPEDPENFEKFWGTASTPNAVQYAGKDNLRPQSAMWQAMLMAAKLPRSKQIVVGGFITSDGQKMSKSLGNVVNPYEIVEKYGTDALRYYLVREINPFNDGDFTWEKMNERYNADLANGLGNLVSRVMKMAAANDIKSDFPVDKIKDAWKQYEKDFADYDLQSALNKIWSMIRYDDLKIQQDEPFRKIKTNPEEAKKVIQFLLTDLLIIGKLLEPFMPETSEKILEAIRTNSEIKTPLFPRK